MRNDKLIEKLSNLKLEESSLKRNLDRNYCNLKIRTKMFEKLKDVKKEIKNVKFQIRLEREMKKNEKSR
jgi:hypothetical protein